MNSVNSGKADANSKNLATIKSLESQLKEMTQKCEESSLKEKTLEERISELTKSLEEKESQIEKLKSDLEKVNEECQKLNEEKIGLESQLETEIKEKEVIICLHLLESEENIR